MDSHQSIKPINPNKHLKEQFVSNLTGSSMLEIAALSLIVPALVVLRQWSGFCILNVADAGPKKNDHVISRHKLWRTYMLSLAMDFLFVVLPMLTIFTVMSDWAYICAMFLTFLLVSVLLVKRFWLSAKDHGTSHFVSLRRSILSYRVAMMVVTCLCILAVDFRIFPRRYAKTETYGTGLMDLGVGSFVVANSLVSQQARYTMSMKWKSALRSTGPLICLGITRLISTSGVDYQVHVGEYGVHWNFFFTLAAVSLLTSLINIHPKYCGIFSVFIIVGYQLCLMCGLNSYLLSNNRKLDIISQNKEGLFSIFGYWAMYLAGVHLGHKVFFASDSAAMTSVQSARIKVWILAIFFWLSTIILDKHVERVSRRMCNLAYVTLVFAQNFQVLAILMLSDLVPGTKTLVLEETFNRNMLGSFLLANLLTGFINLYIDTLSASSYKAYCILFGYFVALSFSVGVAGFFGIKFKFW